MTISAKYAARCSACSGQIRPGDSIEWAKGSPVRHTTCPAAQAATPTTPGRCHCGAQIDKKYKTCYRHSQAAQQARAAGVCVGCGEHLGQWERSHGVLRCIDCRDGGARARGGMSYYDRRGHFVLGEDD